MYNSFGNILNYAVKNTRFVSRGKANSKAHSFSVFTSLAVLEELKYLAAAPFFVPLVVKVREEVCNGTLAKEMKKRIRNGKEEGQNDAEINSSCSFGLRCFSKKSFFAFGCLNGLLALLRRALIFIKSIQRIYPLSKFGVYFISQVNQVFCPWLRGALLRRATYQFPRGCRR